MNVNQRHTLLVLMMEGKMAKEEWVWILVQAREVMLTTTAEAVDLRER